MMNPFADIAHNFCAAHAIFLEKTPMPNPDGSRIYTGAGATVAKVYTFPVLTKTAFKQEGMLKMPAGGPFDCR